MSVMPVPSDPESGGQTCPGCGSPLASDQRYCLNCGRPSSPVRLAFLDVLQGQYTAPGGVGAGALPGAGASGAASGQIMPATGTVLAPPLWNPPPQEQKGLGGWARRNSGLLGLAAVLLLTGLIGLLVGHWVSGGSGAQTVRVVLPNGLPAAAAAASTTPAAPSTPASSASASHQASKAHAAAKSEAATEAEEEEEAKKLESKPAALPAPKKQSKSALQHTESTTGKKHTEEVEKLASGSEPIETTGG